MKLFRLSMLTGAALCALAAGAAHAQERPDDQVVFSADQASVDEAERLVLEGSAELHYRDRTLRADKVTRDPVADYVSAEGNVQLFQSDGSVAFARSLIFNEALTTGVARGFSARLPENAVIAADSLVQRDENFSELNQAIFTTCDICNEAGEDKVPTWSIEADKVVRDEADKSINYRNAVIRIKGVPVLYAPFFSHADPTAERRSGLLAPDFSATRRRGFSYEQPVLWAISPYQDLVVSPQMNTEVSPFLNMEWRKRFYSGRIEARAGGAYERDFNASGLKFGESHLKAYVLGWGDFEIDPWRFGFTAEAARNRRLFDQYSITLDRPDHGLYRADDRRLISQIYAVRQTNQVYFSAASLAFQSLRPEPGAQFSAFGVRPLEDSDVLPVVAPLIELRYAPENPVLGGRLRVIGSGVALARDESPVIPGWPGIDTRRASLGVDWRRAFTLQSGIRLEPFGNLRGDAYSVADLTLADQSAKSVTRAIPTAGVDITWPFVRQDGAVTTIIEPVVQVALSPDTRIDPLIPNEDSLAFDFDETNLFEFNKFPGYDLYEGGRRINVGVVTSIDWGDERFLRLVVGQSFRDDETRAFPPRTGLSESASDWVVGAEAQPVPGLWLYGRARFDDADLRRFEGGVNATFTRGSGYLRYLQLDQDFQGLSREDVEAAGELFVTENWGLVADAVRDLELQTWRRRAIGLVYRDECLRFELLYRRDNNPVLGNRASQSVVVRLTLATLGDAGYRDYRNR